MGEQDLKVIASGNVSAFVTAAARHGLDRQRLHAFAEELVAELGPSDEAEVVRYSEMFDVSAAAEAGRHPHDGGTGRGASYGAA